MRSLLVSKFIPGLNAVAAPLAGSSRAGFGRFLLFDSLGSVIWIGAYVYLGYIFSGQLELVAGYAVRMGSGLILLIVALLAVWIVWKFLQRRHFLRTLAGNRITAEELRDKLHTGEEVLILDVRGGSPVEESLIPGSIRIPAEVLAERHQDIPRDRDVVLVCS
jgi:hypothetical protein